MAPVTVKTTHNIVSHYHGLLSSILNERPEELVLFSHFGDFNQVKIDSILRLLESGILEIGDKRSIMKRFYSLVVEALQNISLHGAKDGKSHMHAYVVVTWTQNKYHFYSGNLVLAGDIKRIEQRMNVLSQLDKSGLRKQYIETLCNEDFTYKGGAGLGLLTMAKKSSEPLQYVLSTLDAGLGYFEISMTMSKDNSAE
jgi:Family of unknown function (DUF6272)